MPIKQVPKVIDVEKALLGSLMMYPENCDCAYEQGLNAEDFYVESHRRLYTAIMDMFLAKKTIDIVSVSAYINDLGQAAQIGGTEYLLQVVDMATAPANAEYYIQQIQEKAVLRKLIEVGQEIGNSSMEHSYEIDEVLDEAEKKILNITRNRRTTDFQPSAKVIDEVMELLKERQKGNGMTGVVTNFQDLDRVTNGFQKGDLIVVAARPAVGKTAFALNMALNASLYDNRTVALFSLEMPATQLLTRMMSCRSNVEANKFRNGRLNNSDWNSLMETANDMKSCKLFIDDSSSIKTSEIFSKCRKLKGEHQLDLVVIDYMQLITGSGHTDSRQQEVSEISRNLKQLARELECPVIALSQLSRKAEERGEKPPQLSDLRESGAIEQDADIVMFLHDPAHNKQDKAPVRPVEVIIAKHRNGSVANIKLTFETNYSRFSNYTASAGEGQEFA